MQTTNIEKILRLGVKYCDISKISQYLKSIAIYCKILYFFDDTIRYIDIENDTIFSIYQIITSDDGPSIAKRW